MLLFSSVLAVNIGHSIESKLDLHYSQTQSTNELYPLSYEDIEISRDGIFLNFHGQSIPLKGIIQDMYGNLFGTTTEWSFKWRCPKCQFENGTFSKTCANCGYRPCVD